MARPKILLLTPWAPFPLDAGSRRIWTACRCLKDRYDFSLLTFFNPRTSYSGVAEPSPDVRMNTAAFMINERRHLADVFRKVHLVETNHEPGPEFAAGLRLPDDARRFRSERMLEKIQEVLRAERPDLVHIEYDMMAPYVDCVRAASPGIPCLLTHHDMGSVSLFRSYFRELADWRRFLRLESWWRRLRYTRDVCRRFDGVVLVTDSDRRLLDLLIGRGRSHAVSTGVDTRHFSEILPRESREPRSLIFVGHYPHYPNEQAVVRFVREILPIIRRRMPDVRFYAAGSDPTPPVKALAREPGVVVTGTLEDIKPPVAGAMAMVAPLQLGRGIKGKLLEAFALGTPVVASSRANEGILAVPERDLLLADSPAAFAEQVFRVLEDGELWRTLSRNGRALVEASHSWDTKADQLDAVYRGSLRPRRKPAAKP